MEKLSAKWERLCASSGIVRFVDINLRGIAQVMFQNNPLSGALFLAAIGWGSYAAGAPHVAIAGLLAVVVATLTAQWLRVDEASLASGLYGYNGILVGLALATFLAPGALLCGSMWCWVPPSRSSSCLAPPTPSSRGGRPHISIRAHDLAAPAGHLWVLRAHRHCAACPAMSSPRSSPMRPARSSSVDLVQGVLQSISQVFLKGSGVAALASARGARREFARRRRIRSRGCDTGGADGASFRCRKRPDYRRSARLQPGPDRDRARHCVLSAELARRGVYGAGHGFHSHRAGGAECCVDAVRHSGTDRAFRAGDLAVSASTAVFRANHRTVSADRWTAQPLTDDVASGFGGHAPWDFLGYLLGLALLMWLAFRGWSVLLVAPAAALLAAAMSGEPLLAHWTQTFMGGACSLRRAMVSHVPARRVVRQAHG